VNKQLGVAAFMVGLITVGWVGIGYAGAHPLALTMTALIAAFYGMGGLELRRFHQATSSLGAALAALPEKLPQLGDWLATVPPPLRNAVRLRIAGERVGLPGPAMTPYLVGLLVLLGMLGTFLGMVVTLNGAVKALESTTDLQAIRNALAAPVKGLGLAFGTSVAGVAASAMLGLVSALCRRERQQTAQQLDTAIATRLRAFSRAHQRQASFEAQQAQAEALPAMVGQLQAMVAQMDRQHQALSAQLLAGQAGFHQQAQAVYSTLAGSVDQSLKASLAESARIAGATVQPVVDATMAGMARATTALHAGLADTVQRQLDGVSERFDGAIGRVADTWQAALAQQAQAGQRQGETTRQALAAFDAGFEQRATALLATVHTSQAALQASLATRDDQQRAALTQSLEAMAVSLQTAWQQAGAASLAQQQQICATLDHTARNITAQAEVHARNTLAQITSFMHTAAAAPQAAAEVIHLMRDKLSDSLARDNTLLDERQRILGALNALLDSATQAAAAQHGAIDGLVSASAAVLGQAGTRFAEAIDAQSTRLTTATTQITGSAVEVASLGEAFGLAVQRFGESNDQLVAQLQRIEAALGKSTVRSDEQLAYYVAQARELIDLSLLSQKQIVDDVQRLAHRPGAQAAHTALAGEAA